jgi:subtilisin family serine protease
MPTDARSATRWILLGALSFAAACQDGALPVQPDHDVSARLAPALARVGSGARGAVIPGGLIVVLDEGVSDVRGLARSLAAQSGGEVGYVYEAALKGFSLSVPPAATAAVTAALARHPQVLWVDDDVVMEPSNTQSNATWGLDRIDQRALPLNGSYTYQQNGAGVTAYIIDSGIYYEHEDFQGRAALGYDFVGDGLLGGDCMGHGTHVAGTVGGARWGVAKAVNLVSVRVFGCSGGTASSTTIAAVDWVTANGVRPAVVNMSLGGGFNSASNAAVTRSIEAGFVYSVSAGNDSGDACLKSPASTPLALTVGATTSTDQRSSFSNYGDCVDVFAPGSSITSAAISGPTASRSSSGTSMSAPHVAGAAALLLGQNPSATPLQVREAVMGQATLGVVGNALSKNANLLYSLASFQAVTPVAPSVTTGAVTNVTSTSATVAGEVTSAGSAAVTARGICWSTTTNPGLGGTCAQSGSGVGSFSVGLQGLAEGTTYHARAYATNSVGTSYGNQVSFTTTLSDAAPPTIPVFDVRNASSGQWTRAEVSWTVADDAALASVRVDLLNGDQVVDGQTIAVSGTSASGLSSLRTRGAAQAVRLTVTDAAGRQATATCAIGSSCGSGGGGGDDGGGGGGGEDEPPAPPPPPPPATITLTGTGTKVKGEWVADLAWSGADGGTVRIFRDGSLLTTAANAGSYRDVTTFKGGGSLQYRVCEASPSEVCSDTITITF